MKVIFLDIDGVLTSVRTGWFNMDIYAVNFLRWACKKSGAKIVISSTWRYNHGEDFWKPIFEEHLHEDFKTPDLTVKQASGLYTSKIRGDEIKAWLDAHPEITYYVIIDDDADMLKAQEQYLIQTDSLNGMLDTHMMELRSHLKLDGFPKEEINLYQHENMFAASNAKRAKSKYAQPKFTI